MTPPPGPVGRIVIDPDDLRRVAVRMRGGAVLLSEAGRALAARAVPAMLPRLGAMVREVIGDTHAELQDIAVELVEEAHMLSARAEWVELGGEDVVSWLIPGLHRFPGAPAPATPVDVAPPRTSEQIRAGTDWAVDILDRIDSSGEAPGKYIGSTTDDVLRKSVLAAIETYGDELPVTPLGRFTLAAGGAVDIAQDRQEGSLESGETPGLAAGGGALGTGLGMLFLSPTGWGIAGCAITGGLIGSAGEL